MCRPVASATCRMFMKVPFRPSPRKNEKRPAGKRAVFLGNAPNNYFLALAGVAVAAGSWVLGWMASMTGVAMKTEA